MDRGRKIFPVGFWLGVGWVLGTGWGIGSRIGISVHRGENEGGEGRSRGIGVQPYGGVLLALELVLRYSREVSVRLWPTADSVFRLKISIGEAVGSGNESKRCHVFEVRIFWLFLYLELALICALWLFCSDDISW